MKKYVLKDNLNHYSFNWPATLLKYPLTEEVDNGMCLITRGKIIPYQIEEDSIYFVSDMPYGSKYEFTFEKGKAVNNFISTDNKISLNNIEVANGTGDTLLTVYLKDKGIKFVYTIVHNVPIKSITRNNSCGAVFSTKTIKVEFASGALYVLNIKLIDGINYIDIKETMEGFVDSDDVFLQISWEGFSPTSRLTNNREEEAIDSYLNEEGRLPFTIMPFKPWNSWWQSYMGIYKDDKGFATGIIINETMDWDDTEYAIWGSSETLAIKPFVDKWVAPIKKGKRGFIMPLCTGYKNNEFINIWFYYGQINLNKVKDWVLDWEDDKSSYPKCFKNTELPFKCGFWYFDRETLPDPKDMIDIIDNLGYIFNHMEVAGPVGMRTYQEAWIPIFDMTASRMTDAEFKKCKAVLAFVAYSSMQESLTPTRTMLGGHPNFLADIVGTVGAISGILNNHPDAKVWRDYFEVATAINLKYHTRPDVLANESVGGRWTENQGIYLFAFLRASLTACYTIQQTSGEITMLYPNFAKLAKFMLNALNAPIEGKRGYSPQGAHSGTGEAGLPIGYHYSVYYLAKILHNYDPMLSENILSIFRDEQKFNKEVREKSFHAYEMTDEKWCKGTLPELKSIKSTGYGCMLRNAVGTAGEMNVFLQQIDEGPNYRWGRAAEGGNGVIYYNAGGKRYSFNGPEDVGDELRGDTQSSTNFGVLIGKEFRAVGRNELTEPLYDFEFVQHAKINAGSYSQPYYKFRSVMMVNNDYIVVYDAVRDSRVRGRFSWFVHPDEDFPDIFNILPGVGGSTVVSGKPIDSAPEYSRGNRETKGKSYEGRGDFLTVVTHRIAADWQSSLHYTKKTSYGLVVALGGRVDHIFNNCAKTNYISDKIKFEGYVGYITTSGKDTKAAIISGSMIGNDKFTLTLQGNIKKQAISIEFSEKIIKGKTQFEKAGTVILRTAERTGAKLFINGIESKVDYDNGVYEFSCDKGISRWDIAAKPSITKAVIERIITRSGEAYVKWSAIKGAETYEIAVSKDNEKNYRTEIIASDTNATIKGENGKRIHVRVRGIRDDFVGEWSSSYPADISEKPPSTPDGLRIMWNKEAFNILWGRVLGAKGYKLYRTYDSVTECIFCGDENSIITQKTGDYNVVSFNDNGESKKSLLRSTEDSDLVHWDPRPEEGFRRDTRSNEHGFPGFPFIENDLLPILTYKDAEDKE